MADNKKQSDTKVITGECRASFQRVFEAAAMEGETDKKYSIVLLIPKSDKITVAKINAAIEAAKTEAKTNPKSNWGGKIPPKLMSPLNDGDVKYEEKGREEYKGHWYINAKSTTKPGVVDEKLDPIIERDQFYSGCYCRASINFFGYGQKGNFGISAALNNVQKLRDGEPLGGFSTPQEDFGEAVDRSDDNGTEEDVDDLL